MKKLLGYCLAAFCVLSGLVFSSCATDPAVQRQKEMAESHPFGYFFPDANFTKEFPSLDEAYDYVNSAFQKLQTASNMSPVQGLSAKLSGPKMPDDTSVIVAYFLKAGGKSSYIDLKGIGAEAIEQKVRGAISVECIFLIYYENRGVSISRFYLVPDYYYETNSQYNYFKYNGVNYTAEYPVGWNIRKAFMYLRKELD